MANESEQFGVGDYRAEPDMQRFSVTIRGVTPLICPLKHDVRGEQCGIGDYRQVSRRGMTLDEYVE